MNPVLEMRKITKRFPGIIANQDVDLRLYPGEVHALCGENGAGKSTLMNILTGIYFPNEGDIIFNGNCVEIDSPHTAVKLGIGMVHQHFKLVDTLSVADNIALYSKACGLFLNKKRMEEKVEDISKRFHLSVNPSAIVGDLSIGEQQRVEILKLLASGAEILILDEPTAVLTPQESDVLFESLKKMAKEGKSILVITHKLSEVMKSADRVTILRGGRSVGEMLLSDTNAESLAEMMVGHHVEHGERGRGRKISDDNVLEIKDVSLKDDRGIFLLKSISLNLRRSEVLGIAGVSGNGQKELCEILAGMKKPSKGTITINGKELGKWNTRKAIDSGVAYIPDDRIGVALAGHLDAMDNMIMKDFMSKENSNHGILNKKAIRNKTEKAFEEYDVRSAGIEYPVAFMSGGNIQKLLIAREVMLNPSIIIASYPTHGLDIGATESVHRILLSECEKGKSVLYVSEDLDELFEVSDRIAVMYDGKIVGVVSSDKSSIEEVGSMMLGNSQERK